MSTSLIWFRKDLRLNDNPALNAAIRAGKTIAIYVHEHGQERTEARNWWLHHSLEKLEESLKEKGVPLVYLKGDALTLIPAFAQEQNATHVYWNRRYTEEGRKTDETLKAELKNSGLHVSSFTGNLLHEPWEVKNKQGNPFKVFTPMFKEVYASRIPACEPLAPSTQAHFPVQSQFTISLDGLNLINRQKTWHKNFEPYWEIGEKAAEKKFKDFLENKIENYKNKRDFPAVSANSTLSPHLHFGEISVRDTWHTIEAFKSAHSLEENENIKCFQSELVWREFAYQQLYFYDDISRKPIHEKFENFPWVLNEKLLKAWQKGQTGIPIVDAGMRELWQTGTMHNRVRMIVASLLTKNMLISWTEGAKWFMDTLLDADEASNSASWQWVAGCGLDAAPYFRIFNPVTQGERFDAEGAYIKCWVSELKDLESKYIHAPWEAPAFSLKLAGVELGKTYPHPVVDLKKSRALALEAYNFIK